MRQAIAAFVNSLHTTGSRFDRWLAGDEDALSPHELEGYRWFKHYGCHSCHQGAAAGGNFFMQFGVLNDYFHKRGNITKADRGRFNITGNKEDMYKFKVPSLRMVVHTAPYLHDGNAKTLRDARRCDVHLPASDAPPRIATRRRSSASSIPWPASIPWGPPLPTREDACW